MLYYPYYLNISIRILLLLANCMAFAFSWYDAEHYFTMFNLGLLIIVQTGLFIYYLNKTNRDLAFFFDSLKNQDSGLSDIRAKKQFSSLYRAMVELNQQIQSARIKYIAQDQYFKTIFEDIRTGIISIGPDGSVDMINKAARYMLGIHEISRIDSLNKLRKGLGNPLRDIRPAEKKLIHLNNGRETSCLSITCTALKFADRELKIITLQDIRHELDKKETESWQKLIRILNHEVMNSLAPIMSTTATIKDYLTAKKETDSIYTRRQWGRVFEKTISGLSIIHDRSEGLKSFVEHYKTLNTLPRPVLATINIHELFENCKWLLSDEMQTRRVQCISETAAPDMKLTADKSQIQQVLINLLKNSLESLSETEKNNKVIKLKAFYDDTGKVVLQVSDNGKGIPQEVIDQIFVPFYTTKEKGSGIGLSLSRQIMHAHNGTISVYSVPNQETAFTLVF